MRKQNKKEQFAALANTAWGILTLMKGALLQEYKVSYQKKIHLAHTEVRNVHVIAGILKCILFQLVTMSIFRFQFNL